MYRCRPSGKASPREQLAEPFEKRGSKMFEATLANRRIWASKSSAVAAAKFWAMPLRYDTGEEIERGDHVRFHGEPGEIEFVADAASPDPETAWAVEGFGHGAMIIEPTHFGRVFVSEPDTCADLEFVARAEA